MQDHIMFNNYTPPDPDEDGYTESTSTTSTESSGRTQRGVMNNTPLFSVESYDLKWTNILARDVSRIKKEVKGKASVLFHHFNTDTCVWETTPFYVANIKTGYYSLREGDERCSELSFQITAINPS